MGPVRRRQITRSRDTANRLAFQNLADGNLTVKTQVIFCYQLFYSREKSLITAVKTALVMLWRKVVKLRTESTLNADCSKWNLSSHLMGVARATSVTTPSPKKFNKLIRSLSLQEMTLIQR